MYTNSVGVLTTLNSAQGGNVVPTTIRTFGEQDGVHLVVDHKNHGMYHENNRVVLSGVESDIVPTKLTSPYASDATTDIQVDSVTNLGTFENVGVSATTPGYLKIGDEIIEYTSTDGSVIGGVTRGIDSTQVRNYVTGTPVYKYEMGGVSLEKN